MDLLFVCPSDDDDDDDWPRSPSPCKEIPEFSDFSDLYISFEKLKPPRKMVRFDEITTFIPSCNRWSEEDYSIARMSDWQSIYLDRLRFEKRILEINSIIGHIFIQHYQKFLMASSKT